MLLLLACSLENELDKDGPPPTFDTNTPDDSGVDTAGGTDEEVCNGEDDDGDGVVDEGFADDDGNGRADCVDVECPALDLAEGGSVTIDADCAGEASDNPWGFRTLWTYGAPSACGWCYGTLGPPIVAQLDDDDADGDIDEHDQPEVLGVVSGSGGYIVVLDGATGAEEALYPDVDGFSTVLVADIDADGSPDLVTGSYNSTPFALEADGSPKWTASDGAGFHAFAPLAADLDGDGTVEIIDQDQVFEGASGKRRFVLDVVPGGLEIPVVADVDQDGDQEIVVEGKLFDSDGALLWDSGRALSSNVMSFVVQADADDEAEIGIISAELSLYEADGTEIFSVPYPTSNTMPGPPCAGDLDGDGAMEVAFPSYDVLLAYELDGTLLWSYPIDDSSSAAGCSVFDLDGDGAHEVLYEDQQDFHVVDGRTGTARFIDPLHDSSTMYDYPTVADLDGDGHAELLVPHQGPSLATFTVYTNDGSGWPATGTTWGAHDWSDVNLEPDGGVPAEPDAPWLTSGVYRGRSGALAGPADLRVAFTDQCVADCTWGPVRVALSVENAGGSDVEAGALLTLYADDDAGPRLVATETLPAIAAGTRLDGIQVDLAPADVGCCGWIARVDEADAVRECDDTNNEAWTGEGACP